MCEYYQPENVSWDYRDVIEGRRGKLFAKRRELARELLEIYGVDEELAKELADVLLYLSYDCEHNKKEMIHTWVCNEYPEYHTYWELLYILMPVLRTVIDSGVLNIDMVDIQNLLHITAKRSFHIWYEYVWDNDDIDSFEKKLKAGIREDDLKATGVLVCIRGNNLKFSHVQLILNRVKWTFKDAEMVFGVTETLADMQTRITISLLKNEPT